MNEQSKILTEENETSVDEVINETVIEEVNEEVKSLDFLDELENDPIYDYATNAMNDATAKIEDLVQEMIASVEKRVSNQELTISECFLAITRTLGYGVQMCCVNEEQFQAEMQRANILAVNKMLQSIVDENYGDVEVQDMSVRRIMLALCCLSDNVFWKSKISEYVTNKNKVD